MAQISRRLRFEILRRDGHTCRYCGAQAPDVKLEVDHVIPDTLGGATESSNLVTACFACNRGKASVPADAPIMENVARDALRWKLAMEEAANLWRLERDMADEATAKFMAHWKAGFAKAGFPVDVPDDWTNSIERFMSLGFGLADLQRMADAVIRKLGWSRYQVHPYGSWKYFCGRVWRTLSDLQEDARRMVEEEDSGTCPG